jgi:hypothetical protein
LHRRWANENWQFIADDTTTFDFSGKRAFLSQHDILFSSNDWRTPLVNLLESNPHNKTAADYLLCFYLLRKDLEQFKVCYDAYYHPAFGSTVPPELYQEALLMCMDATNEQPYVAELQKYAIEQTVRNRSHEFLTLIENMQRNETQIRSTFATSYWFYYFFAQMK